MKIGFFDTKEFESKDGKPSPFDDTVVKRELIVMLNAIRSRYGKPIVVNSGYRSPEHNAAVGGFLTLINPWVWLLKYLLCLQA